MYISCKDLTGKTYWFCQTSNMFGAPKINVTPVRLLAHDFGIGTVNMLRDMNLLGFNAAENMAGRRRSEDPLSALLGINPSDITISSTGGREFSMQIDPRILRRTFNE